MKKDKQIKIFGFHPLMFLFFVAVCALHLFAVKEWGIKKLYHPLLTPLFIIFVLGYGLNFIGDSVPYLNKIGLGFLLCIFVPSYLVYKGWIPQDLADKCNENFFSTKTPNNHLGSDFANFFITCVIAGSILSVDRNLLKRSLSKFLPLTLIVCLLAILSVGFVGFLFNYQKPEGFSTQGSFLDSIFYVAVPLTNGGTNLGINGFANGIYKDAFPQLDQKTIRTAIIVPLIMARCLSILFAGLMYVIFDKTKFSGKGKLEYKNNKLTPKPTEKKTPLEYKNIGMGLTMIFVLFSLSSLLNKLLWGYLESLVYFILFLILIRVFNLLSQENQSHISQAGQVISKNFTTPILAGLGMTVKWQQLMGGIKQIPVLTMVLTVLLVVVLVSFVLAKAFGFYPFETSITAGLGALSVGGTGHLGIMSISKRDNLLPFIMIATRIIGPIIYTLAYFLFKFFYMS
ncbi:MAG: sodium/malate symporter MaeN [Candidatus Phytoplasma asteris]|nr:MAG: malate/citrate symporter [Periwinkle leaf yellowing phytoplasma]WEX19835.1 MAG: sodium/malate symporter MaeN [Candidatus Phytoplasma asteris]